MSLSAPEKSPRSENRGDINKRFNENEDHHKGKEGISKESEYNSKERKRSKEGRVRAVFKGDMEIKYGDIFLFYVDYLLSCILSVIITSAILTLMGVECIFIFS